MGGPATIISELKIRFTCERTKESDRSRPMTSRPTTIPPGHSSFSWKSPGEAPPGHSMFSWRAASVSPQSRFMRGHIRCVWDARRHPPPPPPLPPALPRPPPRAQRVLNRLKGIPHTVCASGHVSAPRAPSLLPTRPDLEGEHTRTRHDAGSSIRRPVGRPTRERRLLEANGVLSLSPTPTGDQ